MHKFSQGDVVHVIWDHELVEGVVKSVTEGQDDEEQELDLLLDSGDMYYTLSSLVVPVRSLQHEATRIVREDIREHIEDVQFYAQEFADMLIDQVDNHDRSKSTPEEMGPLVELKKREILEGGLPEFGTPEYDDIKRTVLEPMIENHYSCNPHHPEHDETGIFDMDLITFIEMFMDWKSAAKQRGNDIIKVTFLADKYEMPEMLVDILKNTCDRMGWKYD